MRRARIAVAAAALAGLLTGAAVGAAALVREARAAHAPSALSPQGTQAARSPLDPQSAARRAPDFVAFTIEGKTFRLSAQRGRVVVLEFLLPGCPECVRDALPLERTAARFASRGVKVVIVDISGASARLLRDYYRGDLELPRVVVVRDRPFSFKIARSYEITGPGMTFVVDRKGSIGWQGYWTGKAARLHAAIEAALG